MEVYHNGYVLWDKDAEQFIGFYSEDGGQYRTNNLCDAIMWDNRDLADYVKNGHFANNPDIIVRTFRYILEAL